MKIFPSIILIIVLISCDNSSSKKSIKNSFIEKQNFFPVTTYIKGQLLDITKRGVNPIKYTTIKNHTDSIWLKTEDFEKAVKEFLTPEIDSANLISLFTEKKFLDQTIDAYTLTYDPINELPDTITLRRWDVYIDPTTGNVKRVYLLKNINATKTLQLTWQSNKWCKIITIKNSQDGNSEIEKEEKINWEF